MKKFWFTWGSGQEHPNCYTVVEAVDQTEARAMMCARCGHRWSMMYDSAADCGVTTYGLRYLPFDSFALPSDEDFANMLRELFDLEHGLSYGEIAQLDMVSSYLAEFDEFTWQQRALIRTLHESRVP